MKQKIKEKSERIVDKILRDIDVIISSSGAHFAIPEEYREIWIKEVYSIINMEDKDEIFRGCFDGSAKPNPGKMQCGYVIYDSKGLELQRGSKKFGHGTNNRAEYYGLINLLETATNEGIKNIHIQGDSELVIRQMTMKYRVNKPEIKELWKQAQELLKQFKTVTWEEIPREHNFAADLLTRT